MKEHYDPWLVRLPDGRILNAKSSASVRHHVEAGNIPLNSSARRTTNEEWVGLARIPEFSDLTVAGNRSLANFTEGAAAPSANGTSPDVHLKSGISARLDPLRLQTVGIRGLVDELIAALDSTMNSRKLAVTGLAAVAMLLGQFLISRFVFWVYPHGVWLAGILAAIFMLGVLAGIVSLLTRQTHLELSRMRPISLRQANNGLGPLIFRVFLGYFATIGIGLGMLLVLRNLSDWVDTTSRFSVDTAEAIETAIGVVGLGLAILIGHIILLSWLIAPILVVEECSLGDALREWRALLREHRVRVLIYEGMAITLALISALPVALPVYFGLRFSSDLAVNGVITAAHHVAVGLALGPAIAFLAVANLFIYLNLRYEYSPQK